MFADPDAALQLTDTESAHELLLNPWVGSISAAGRALDLSLQRNYFVDSVC